MSQNQEDISRLIDNWEDIFETFYRLSVMYSAFPFLVSKGEISHDV